MTKRRFHGLLALGLIMLLVPKLSAQAASSIEGKYVEISPPQPTAAEGKVELIEAFSYGCGHCFSFRPQMDQWLEQSQPYVAFRRLPIIFDERWTPFAQAFYTAEKLGVINKTHPALFDAIHVEKKRFRNEKDLQQFFEEQGIDAAEFKAVYESFAVQAQVRQGLAMQHRYRVNATPALIVNGKYLITPRTAGGFDGMLAVAQALIEREHTLVAAEQ